MNPKLWIKAWICKFDTRITKFETQVVAPFSWQAWFHTPWTVERANPTHLAYNLSGKPTIVDDGVDRISGLGSIEQNTSGKLNMCHFRVLGVTVKLIDKSL